MFGLLIDKVSDILDLDDAHFELPLNNMPASAAELIVGYYKLPNRLLFILDTDKLISGCLTDS